MSKGIARVMFFLNLSLNSKYKTLREYYKSHLKLNENSNEVFTFSLNVLDITTHPAYKECDVVHLHWVSSGFLNYEIFFKKNKKPTVWTLHDMNPFTGGCHFSGGCRQYTTDCSNCAYAEDSITKNLIKDELSRKIYGLSHAKRLTIISPSKFLHECSINSTAFKKFVNHVIPYPIDERIFNLKDKAELRKKYNISDKAKVILFVAAHNINKKRKGIQILIESLNYLDRNILVCTVGKGDIANLVKQDYLTFGEIISEQKLAEVYNLADIFVAPSLEDNLPNTVLESLMCGTPVIAFNIGGMSDMIHVENGILINEINSLDLARAINKSLNQMVFDNFKIMHSAREKYSFNIIAKRHKEIYVDLLQ
ncbi:MAG: glycosyltransferase [Cyclobacteriaceae bacterium]|nr:glycosyltransferase [Cyclobacteriaceae bacterium]